MARKLNFTPKDTLLAMLKDRRSNGSTHITRKVGYKTKRRPCKYKLCGKPFTAKRSDQLYCNSTCQGKAALYRREQRDKTYYYADLGRKPHGLIDYGICENPNCKKGYPRLHIKAKYCSVLCRDVMRRAMQRDAYHANKET